MTFNPAKHHRHSIRLRGYDYSQPGAYFVTICVRDRQCLFGEIIDGAIRLNEAGEFAKRCWVDIPGHFPHVQLDEFVIMPNHVHGILIFRDFPAATVVGAAESVAPTNFTTAVKRPNGPKHGSVGTIIGQYKSVVTKRINVMHGTPDKNRWQRDFYDHIGRNENELFRIRQYIRNNPANWNTDNENPIVIVRATDPVTPIICTPK